MKGKKVCVVKKLVAMLAAAPFCAFMAQAKVCYFRPVELGNDGYYWSNSNNWVDCQKPVSGDSVYVTNMTSSRVFTKPRMADVFSPLEFILGFFKKA